jgi:phosphatidylglycerol:prolipoprotein diacylglycerol transferase
MNGIVINIDPMALNLGPLHINWYSIIVMTAIISGVAVAIWQGKRKGISSAFILSLTPWVSFGRTDWR